ncbi:hypothetical protein DXC92_18530 [Clostridiales bacterium TF09-2AC]|nr:hypothetical protein DXC92_18530 [Clostridiales bacterium TF09-2AC]
MKKRVKRLVLMAGILCVMSLAVCACGSAKHEPINADVTAPAEQPEEARETPLEETVSTQDSFTENTCGKLEDNNPNLEGSIKELQEGGGGTVVEAITEKSDNGGDIIVSPGIDDGTNPALTFICRLEQRPCLIGQSIAL